MEYEAEIKNKNLISNNQNSNTENTEKNTMIFS